MRGSSFQGRLREYLFAYALIFTFLFVTHAPLLRLPYFWDEAGYFIPAAHDLLLTGSLIPHSTLSNAHPPLVMLWLAFWWRFSAFTPAVTRTAMLLVSAFALLGLWRLARDVANEEVAAATVLCTAVYSVFFAQSSLAHLDMMVCALTLWGLAMYVKQRLVATIVFLALASLAKETAIVTPLALLVWELLCPVLQRRAQRAETLCLCQRSRLAAFWFLLCLVPLALWFTYHHYRTGFYLGNPEYLRYNLQATLSPLRILLAILVRLWHALGYLNLFVLTLAAAYAMSRPPLRGPDGARRPRIPINVQLVFGVVILAHILALSALGGAVLARYMLPAVPLVILICVSTLWRRIRHWAWWIAVTCVAFVFALLIPPPYRIAPEDTLLYRDYVIVHKRAADELAARFPRARVLTAWPASDELAHPFLGYLKQPLTVVPIENFSALEIEQAAQATDQFDVALLFPTKWQPTHPLFRSLPFGEELQERFFDYHDELAPQQVANILGGRTVRYLNRNNEWVAIVVIERVENAATPRFGVTPRSIMGGSGTAEARTPASFQRLNCEQMARTTILEYLDNFGRHAREVAYVEHRGYRMQRWTYGDVLGNAYRFARELEQRGLGKGDKVVLWGENCAEWVVAFFGCLLRGAIVVPIDKIAAPDFAQRVAQQVDARLCVGPMQSHIPGIAEINLETLREQIAAHSDQPVAPPALTRDDIVQFVFTSGTTAEPRGVVISHGNILANLEPLERQIGEYLRYERIFHPLRFLNLLPLSHVFGQFLGIFLPQLLSATVIFQDTLNPTEVLHVIKRERASVVVAVPRLMGSLKDKLLRDFEAAGRRERFQRQFAAAKDQHFVRRWWRFRKIHSQFGWKFWAFISGGAALDAETEEFWRRMSFVVIQGYGLTETTSLISLNHPFRTGKRSIGKVLEGREIKLDENGEILVRGANVAAGYWQGNQLKPVLNAEGWFRTGDLGELDAEGNLYFKGRKKNVIVTREGMNIYPEDLETALRQQPAIRDCVVVGLEQGGNAEPCAVLILRDSTDPEPAVKRANQQLAEYQQMRRWLVSPEQDFPRTPTQKPKIAAIQQAVQQHFASGNDGAGTPQGALADLIAHVTGHSTVPLTPVARLDEDLNLSSMDRVELMSALEDRYQVDLNEANFTSVSTVGDLERLLRGPQKSPQSRYRYPRWAQRWPIPWIRNFIYYLLTWPATMIMAHPKIVGRENLRGLDGPFLISCNHVTYIDVGFALIALPPGVRHKLAVGMWGEMLWEMWRPPQSWNPFLRLSYKVGYYLVVALFNVFPLPQQSGVRESFAYAGESVDRGYSVLVYPEGARTPDGKPSPFRSGVGMLASRLNVPVVPLRIDGLYQMKMAGHKIARRGELTVVIGKPMRFPPATPAEEITNQIEHVTWNM